MFCGIERAGVSDKTSGNEQPRSQTRVTSSGQRVLLVDASQLVLRSLETLMAIHGFAIAGTATSTARALELLAAEPSDVVLLSIRPLEAAIAAVSEIRRHTPKTAIVVRCASVEEADIEAILDEGAAAYVHESAGQDDLVTAVRQALHQSMFLRAERPPAAKEEAEPPRLTRRERELLALLTRGSSNAELAQTLWVTEQTVKFHLSNIYRKLGVANRAEASRYGEAHGLLPADQSDSRVA